MTLATKIEWMIFNMIKIKKAKEIRKRDEKRNRFLLVLGKKKWHITEEEAFDIYFQVTAALEKAGLIN